MHAYAPFREGETADSDGEGGARGIAPLIAIGDRENGHGGEGGAAAAASPGSRAGAGCGGSEVAVGEVEARRTLPHRDAHGAGADAGFGGVQLA